MTPNNFQNISCLWDKQTKEISFTYPPGHPKNKLKPPITTTIVEKCRIFKLGIRPKHTEQTIVIRFSTSQNHRHCH